MNSSSTGFSAIGEIINYVLKEVRRRSELRPRLEAELGHPLTDEEFITIAESTGIMI